MSLFKQMVIMLSLLLMAVLASVMFLNFKNATEFVQNQLYNDARNTAHSLGLSLSKVADPNDSSTMETMINAIFDSGYYEHIVLTDISGKVIYQRETELKVVDVPHWFIHNVPIEHASAKSDIMIGWSRFGTLEVSGHTGNAYRQLYLTLIDLIQTFTMIGLSVFSILYLLLKLSLQSLVRIKEQAKAIIDNEFIIQEKMPFTTEFRSVTLAMNAMVAKVKDIFERENETLQRYHELLYKDPETKLHNRRYLTAKLPDYLQGDTSLSSGVYVMFSFNEIERFKKELGYERYSKFSNLFTQELNSHLARLHNILLARLNESDYFAVIPSLDIEDVQDKVESIMMKIQTEMDEISSDLREYFVAGATIGLYNSKDTLKSIFSKADYGITQAKERKNFTIDISKNTDDSPVFGRDEWREEILKSLEESRMVLAFQSVVNWKGTAPEVLHEEIFLRLLDREGTIHSAGYFIPVATSLGLVDTLDRYMISKVFDYVRNNRPSTPMALNLSADFVKKFENISWLENELASINDFALPLWFEVSNAIALHEIEAVRTLSSIVKKQGHRFGIDHFAFPEGGAGYLQAIRPDYLKSNGGYLKDMLYDKETGKARESLYNLLKSLGIMLVAIMIEEKEELEDLKKLGISHFQGTHIAPVELLK